MNQSSHIERPLMLDEGGARGLGLAMAYGCADLGGNVALLDILDEPVDDIGFLQEKRNVRAQYFR